METVVRLFVTVLLFTGSFVTRAQEHKRLSGNFEGVPFTDFAATIESLTNYHFYYQQADVDSVRVHLSFSNLSINEVLEKIFADTDLKYAIDEEGSVFITKQFTLRLSLPQNYFSANTADSSDNTAVPSYIKQQGTIATDANAENKLYIIGDKNHQDRSRKATVSGYVRHAKTGEAIIGASVYVDSPYVGISTDQFGYFTLTLPTGQHTIRFSGAGMKETKRRIQLYSDGSLQASLEDLVTSLRAVVVHADRNTNVGNVLMGINRLSSTVIKKIPALLGETDILRAVLTLPGVVSVGEGSTGFNVRGGAADQNLILFSDATVYNPAHLFGFFTAFNPDVVKGVELYKSGIPEKYGGRLSSVLDVIAKEGNSKKVEGIAGVGLLTSKLTVEGPLLKDKLTFIAGGRTTYSNWLLKQIPKREYRNSKASFYDLNAQLNYTVNSRNTVTLMAYGSHDEFQLNSDTLFRYGNKNINIKWKHLFNNRFYGLVILGADRYTYSIAGNEDLITGFQMKFGIDQKTLRTDFVFTPNNKHSFNFGLNSIYYQLQPGRYEPKGEKSLVVPDILQREQALETALYIGDRISFSKRFSLNAGLRYSYYTYLGPKDVYGYVAGLPKSTDNLIDTIRYASGKAIKTYHTPEYRLSVRYSFNDSTSLKASFNSLRQYIHMITNTTSISPTDIWKLSDTHIKPQDGYQLSLGFYKNFRSNSIETSLEVYYKGMSNYLDYKSGAELNMNHHLETEVVSTKGKAYGAELLIKKLTGKLNGWISYAYSRTWLRMEDSLGGEQINGGRYYPANFDKPHNVNFIGNYRFLHRLSASLNVVYNTGRPITLPIALFNTGGGQGLYYSERNQYRIPDYFRIDVSLNLEGNHKVHQRTHNSWTLGVYNVLGRDNPYSVYFVQEGGRVKGYQLSIFAVPIAFISYNIRF